MLVAWEASEDSVLPELKPDMCEGARYVNLRDSQDEQGIEDNKVFWVLFQSGLAAAIHSWPRLSPTIYDKYKNVAAFQITMHNVQIRGRKDPAWVSLLYMVIDEEIDHLIATCPPY